MTFAEYWLRLIDRNPGLARPETRMTQTVERFKASMERAWSEGFAAGKEVGENETSIFGKVFGKR